MGVRTFLPCVSLARNTPAIIRLTRCGNYTALLQNEQGLIVMITVKSVRTNVDGRRFVRAIWL